MKYPNALEMLKQHYNDIIETIDPPTYQDGALYAMSLVVHIMLVCHDKDRKKVIEDIGTISAHAAKAVANGDLRDAEGQPTQRMLH